ncbi:MAG: hypothetical protein JRN56_01905 [Nitrososphaerota archaeon]|nr:hypothetical protein [Nitrososphaerota archaeon]MDG6903790.1 hypothetical protein [Nitrososphaerota archaeon]MDG6911577.1 hypothetical protein [Nitrososphaerota archaeon]MDG6940481.1 hypothetical protein [Nitrososphaerota archaeon]MDG6960792.1 hypothetical protein [Nitrososphaerota archaeon]
MVNAITFDPSLNSKFELKGDYLSERRQGSEASDIEAESRNRARARSNMEYAAKFARLLRPARFKMIAVSGSTSYGSASRSKDLDLFCIAPAGALWRSLTWGLIMARVSSLISPRSPSVCLSCIMDERYAHSKFSTPQGPLFARDALATKVIMGYDIHRSLMKTARWISAYYPAAYEHSEFSEAHIQPMVHHNISERIMNLFMFATAGRYLKLKSSLLNRRLNATRRNWDVFDIQCEEDHLIYESRRYVSMRQRYEALLASVEAGR